MEENWVRHNINCNPSYWQEWAITYPNFITKSPFLTNVLIIVLYETPLTLDPILHVNQNDLIIVYFGIAFGHYHINMLFLMK